jgi:hypothetical protein
MNEPLGAAGRFPAVAPASPAGALLLTPIESGVPGSPVPMLPATTTASPAAQRSP